MPDKNSTALKFPEVRIVEASAGSGKTRALARRYIQLLMHPHLNSQGDPLKSILAITFANKAAFEMKERVLSFLKAIALDNFPSEREKKELLNSMPAAEGDARRMAYEAMERIIRNYNFFQIRTIDSLINTILRASAFNRPSYPSAGFRVKKDYSGYLAYSLDELIDTAQNDKRAMTLLNKFLMQYLYVENKPGWLPKADMLSILLGLLNEVNTYGGSLVKAGRRGGKSVTIGFRKQKILRLMKNLSGNLPDGVNKSFVSKLGAFIETNEDGFKTSQLLDKFESNIEIPLNKGYNGTASSAAAWKSIRREIGKFCEAEAFSLFDCYVDIFEEVFSNFNALSKKEDITFLEELNRQAMVLFDAKSMSLPELYYRMATSYKHFLIDEFQDTSTIQWKNLSDMVDEAISTGGTLFCVGDKKQAIYRFRGGNALLINSLKERYKNVRPTEEFLSCNFRSHREIVEFNNSLFCEDNLKRVIEEVGKGILAPCDVKEVLGVFDGACQEYERGKEGGYVKVELIDYKNVDERNVVVRQKLLGLVKELRKRFSARDIAVLANKNDEVEMLTGWLLEGGVPVESEKTLSIRENSRIKELISLLKFLDFPPDNLFFASFILGDIFLKASGISRASISEFLLRLGRERQDFKQKPYYQRFREEFPQIWEGLFETLYKKVGFLPLYELVISIMEKFCVAKNFAQGQGFFMKFLEVVKRYEEETTSLSAFLDFFEKANADELYVNIESSGAIKVLTIHKAKGLEFPVIIAPFLEMDINAVPHGRKKPYTVREGEDGISLLRLLKEYSSFSECLKELYKEEYKRSVIDELNRIYVALTRASCELYIFVPAKSGNAVKPMRLLIGAPAQRLEMGAQSDYQLKDKRRKSILKDIPASEYKEWAGLLQDEFIQEDKIRNRHKILKGEIYHYILSFVGNLHNQDAPKVLKAALRRASMAFPAIEDFSSYERTIAGLLGEERFSQFFYVEGGVVYQEKEIVNHHGDTKRIDRLIESSGEIMVVDYKSSKDEAKRGHEQVSEYIRIVKDVYPGSDVKGFLIYLDDLSVDEVNG